MYFNKIIIIFILFSSICFSDDTNIKKIQKNFFGDDKIDTLIFEYKFRNHYLKFCNKEKCFSYTIENIIKKRYEDAFESEDIKQMLSVHSQYSNIEYYGTCKDIDNDYNQILVYMNIFGGPSSTSYYAEDIFIVLYNKEKKDFDFHVFDKDYVKDICSINEYKNLKNSPKKLLKMKYDTYLELKGNLKKIDFSKIESAKIKIDINTISHEKVYNLLTNYSDNFDNRHLTELDWDRLDAQMFVYRNKDDEIFGLFLVQTNPPYGDWKVIYDSPVPLKTTYEFSGFPYIEQDDETENNNINIIKFDVCLEQEHTPDCDNQAFDIEVNLESEIMSIKKRIYE
jgi:hypothetical protein